MDARIADAPSRFSDRVFRLLERVEYRIAKSSVEREAVYRLRYDAYRRNGLMEPRADGQLYDRALRRRAERLDHHDVLRRRTRRHDSDQVGAGENAILPSLRVYPDVIEPQLRAGRVARSKRRASRRNSIRRALPPNWRISSCGRAIMAAEHFDADYAVASPRAEHMAFYRRVLYFVPWCEPRAYPGSTAKFACMGANFHANKQAHRSALSLLPLDRRRARSALRPGAAAPRRLPPAWRTSRASAPDRRARPRHHALVDGPHTGLIEFASIFAAWSAIFRATVGVAERCLRAPIRAARTRPAPSAAEGITTSWDLEDWPARRSRSSPRPPPTASTRLTSPAACFPPPSRRRGALTTPSSPPSPRRRACGQRRGQRVEAGRRIGRRGKRGPTIPSSSTGSARSRPRTR